MSAPDPALVAAWLGDGYPVVLVELTAVRGSAPRAAGTFMAVSRDHITGTVGGGALEWVLIECAREMACGREAERDVSMPLGPEIGQCCGGHIDARLTRMTSADMARLRANEVTRPNLYIIGAGHVGTALAQAARLLPLTVTVVDERAEWLTPLAEGATVIQSPLPEAAIRTAPPGTAFVILTHNHALDFMAAEAALSRRDAAYVGMIGSATKRATLASRLVAAGLSDEGLTCPIGAGRSNDKRPEVIAAMVIAEVTAALFP